MPATPPPSATPLSPARWIAITLGCLAVSLGAVAATSYRMDVFGLFHSTAGRQLAVHFNERTAKLYLNRRYVPENFDAVLLGGSSTSNWDMRALTFAHVYNESLYGSNTVEEKRLLDAGLPRAHYRYAICLVSPYMLQSHDFNEAARLPNTAQALLSINTLREEIPVLEERLLHRPNGHTSDGSTAMLPSHHLADPFVDYTFQYDPIALTALRSSLDEMRSRGTRIIFLETPMYGPLYRRHLAQFQQFYGTFPLRQPGEPLITFDGLEYDAIRENQADWVDAPHVNDATAQLLSRGFEQQVEAALAATP